MFLKGLQEFVRNSCLGELGKTRDQTLHALGAKSDAVPGPEILFAGVHTATSGTKTLYNNTG